MTLSITVYLALNKNDNIKKYRVSANIKEYHKKNSSAFQNWWIDDKAIISSKKIVCKRHL